EIALPMAVRPKVPRHAVDDGREVRAVVEIEAAQEVLIRLAASRVLYRDEPRHGLEQLRDLQHRPHEQVCAADGPFAGRFRAANELETSAEHDDLFQGLPALSRRAVCCRRAVGLSLLRLS